MKNVKGQKCELEKRTDFDSAMNQAFSEIFENLKGLEEDTKIRRLKTEQLQRRNSAPASTLKENFGTKTNQLNQPQKQLDRTKSGEQKSYTLPAVSALSTMHWVMQCCEEEEIDVIDSSFSFLDNYWQKVFWRKRIVANKFGTMLFDHNTMNIACHAQFIFISKDYENAMNSRQSRSSRIIGIKTKWFT